MQTFKGRQFCESITVCQTDGIVYFTVRTQTKGLTKTDEKSHPKKNKKSKNIHIVNFTLRDDADKPLESTSEKYLKHPQSQSFILRIPTKELTESNMSVCKCLPDDNPQTSISA